MVTITDKKQLIELYLDKEVITLSSKKGEIDLKFLISKLELYDRTG